MKLSVIIVSYNVRHFLEQCLHSVKRAMQGIDGEVFVVDNDSVDTSCQMVEERFPWVRLIANKHNAGFSAANNQAIRLAQGSYILLLNPDTVIEDDTLRKVVAFMDDHPEAGGLGVKMVDGKGRFLPESKRSLPTPGVAFAKIFGLSRLFPKSRTFGRYHLGYLDNEEIHEVEVLSGAFMLLRRKVLDEIGLLDEGFFMYGEDIDLSYRITQAGYKNYYYPPARIIHYKGESTKKGSANYVFTFYQAMVIFARKHFSRKNARVFSLLIHAAVWFRAGLALLRRLAGKLLMPFIESVLLVGGMVFLAQWWEAHVLVREGGRFPDEVYYFFIPVCSAIWLISIYLSGGYDRPSRLVRVWQGMLGGTIMILVAYALLPEAFRFSRALIVLGAIWGTLAGMVTRYLFHFLNVPGFKLDHTQGRHYALVGEPEETSRVEAVLRQAVHTPGFIGCVHTRTDNSGNGSLGPLARLRDIISIYRIDEVVFCSKSLPASHIIDLMAELQDTGVEYKIAPPESLFVIGSNSINTAGELYVIDVDSITSPANKRHKRLLDFIVAGMSIPLSPLLMLFTKNPLGLISNALEVLIGRKSWVGYIQSEGSQPAFRLPKLKSGVLNPADAFAGKALSMDDKDRLNMLYAKNYRIKTDLDILWRGFKKMGRRQH